VPHSVDPRRTAVTPALRRIPTRPSTNRYKRHHVLDVHPQPRSARHVREKSSRDSDVGWEGLGLVVADALVEAMVQDLEEAVGEMPGGGAVGVAALAASAVVGGAVRFPQTVEGCSCCLGGSERGKFVVDG
jgi:hypothetical protein